MLDAFAPNLDQGHNIASPTGVVDPAHASEDLQRHKQAVEALCTRSSSLQMHAIHFLAKIVEVQPAALQTLRPLGIWDILCGPAFFLFGGGLPPAAAAGASSTAAAVSTQLDCQDESHATSGMSQLRQNENTASSKADPTPATATAAAQADSPDFDSKLQLLRAAVVSLLEKTACMRGLDNTDPEITKVIGFSEHGLTRWLESHIFGMPNQ